MAEQPTPVDEFQVYLSWPEETIRQQLDVFKNGENGMYNGAGPAELAAGLHCLDFLTRASTFSDATADLLEAAVMEAEMRIELMLEQEVKMLEHAEVMAKVEELLRVMQKQLQSLWSRVSNLEPERVRYLLELRLKRLREERE